MVRNILIGLVVLVVVIVGVAFVLPQKIHVERSTVIAASPEQVFAYVNDLSRFNEWSPWTKLDPKMKLKFEGPPAGAGAKMAWESEVTGNGAMEITESTPFSSIRLLLDFGADGKAESFWSFETVEGGTKATWGFDNDTGMNPIGRYMGLMMDQWVGPEYEKGLANLKTIVEATAKAEAAEAQTDTGTASPPDVPPPPAIADPTKGPEVITVDARPIILTRSHAAAGDASAISAALGASYQKLLNYAQAHNLTITGAPMAITVTHNATTWEFDAAMPLEAAPAAPLPETDGVTVGETYSGKVVKLTHKGPYNTMEPSYARIAAFIKSSKLKEGAPSWEEYVSDPGETADDELLTNIYYAVKE